MRETSSTRYWLARATPRDAIFVTAIAVMIRGGPLDVDAFANFIERRQRALVAT